MEDWYFKEFLQTIQENFSNDYSDNKLSRFCFYYGSIELAMVWKIQSKEGSTLINSLVVSLKQKTAL